MSDDLICPKCSAANPPETVFCGKCGSKLAISEGAGDDVDPFLGAFVGDRFLVHEKLGEGGMGVVYRAEQTAIERKVALKVLHATLTRDESLHARFQNEAAACSRLTHPNTVTIYDFGKTDQGSLYIAMEHIDGKSLDDEIRDRGAIQSLRACRIAMQICGSLSDAHRHNIVHRDLKPENIMLCERGGETDVVKVLDFGIAKILEDKGTDQRQALTKTGMVFGTPQYMSPEQIRGEIVDHRTDIYSLGVILYEMLTGVLPFSAEMPMGVLSKHLFDTPPAFKQSNPSALIPEALEDLVMSALAKEADKRPQSMIELRKRLATAADLSQENTLLPTAAAVTVPSSEPEAIAEGLRGRIPSTMMQTTDSEVEPEFKSRAGLVAGIVVALLVVIGGGVGFVFYSGWVLPEATVSPTPASAGIPNSGIDSSKFPAATPLIPDPQLGATTPAVGNPTTPQTGKGLNTNRPKKKKDVPCTYTGASDSISMAVRAAVRQKEKVLKKCVKNNSGGRTVFSFVVPVRATEPKRLRLVTSSVMDSCLERLLKTKFNGKTEKRRVGTASFSLERRAGVLRKCEITVNTQGKKNNKGNVSTGSTTTDKDPTTGSDNDSNTVVVPQKPGKKDDKEKPKKKLPLIITKEN